MELKKRYQKENDDNDHSDKQQKNDDQPRAIKIAEELQQEERESEQVELDPHEVLEEEEKIQPQSQQE